MSSVPRRTRKETRDCGAWTIPETYDFGWIARERAVAKRHVSTNADAESPTRILGVAPFRRDRIRSHSRNLSKVPVNVPEARGAATGPPGEGPAIRRCDGPPREYVPSLFQRMARSSGAELTSRPSRTRS